MTRLLTALGITVTLMAAAACGGGAPQSEQAAAPAAAGDHAGHTGGRVFFMTPMYGAMVKSPVNVVFGSEMFTIAAVPQGEVTEVRPGTGHFHLGLDTDCLPVGTAIPKADPWIHFGMGNNSIEMMLSPGPHKLVVQAGDDKHVTMTGLCETVNITVTE
jgi:hypothetical protein